MNVGVPRKRANAPQTRSFLKLYWFFYLLAVLFTVPLTDSMANSPPTGSLSDVTLTVAGGAQTINLLNHFSDPDGDTLYFAVKSSNQSYVTASVSGSTLTLTPVAKGASTIRLTVADAKLHVNVDFTATVNNSRPTGSLSDVTLTVAGGAQTINVLNHFSDPDGDTLYVGEAFSNYPEYVTVSVSGSKLTLTPVAKGASTIRVGVNDGKLVLVASFTATVNNSAPTVTNATISVAFPADDTHSTNVGPFFSDADGDSLTFTASSSDTSIVTVSVSGSTLNLTGVAEGSATVNVSASDGSLSSPTKSISVTVKPSENNAPTGSLSNITLTAGGNARTIDLSAHISDPDGDTISFSASSSNSGSVAASVSGSTLTITPVTAGSSTISVAANDGKASTTVSFTATVEDSQTPPEDDPEPNPTSPRSIVNNRPPVVVQAIAPIVLFVGDSESVQAQFSDPDGNALSYSVAGGNSAASASMSGNTVTITALAVGKATLTVTATDTHGATTNQTISVTVVVPHSVLTNTPRTPARLLKVSGDNQSAQINTALANPLVVEVRDEHDRVVEGVAVQFDLDQIGATLNATSITDAAGQAYATLMFGDSPGEIAVEVSVAGVDETVVFTARATPLFPNPIHIDALEVTANPGDTRTQRVYGVAFSPDGEMLASAHSDNTVRLWEVETRELKRTLGGHQFAVRSVAFSPDGNILASGGHDGRVLLWEPDTGRRKQTISPGGTVWGIAFSPDGNTLATATEYGHVSIWDITNLKRVERKHRIYAHSVRAWSVAFSPDGDMLASVGGDAIVRLWNPETGEITKVLEGHEEQVLSVAFGDDNILASASADGSVRLWDLEAESSRVLAGHTGWVFSAAFHPNGEILASTGKDNSVRLWDAAAGTPLYVLERHTGWGRSVAISRDGILASAGYDNMIHLWDLGVKLDDLEDMEATEETEADAGGEGEDTAPQQSAELLPNFPNPFNPETWIPYHLSNHADVQISIYDSKGVLVRWLDLGHQAAGYYTDRTQAAYWDGRNEFGEQVASGLYFYRLTAGDYSATRKMLILK